MRHFGGKRDSRRHSATSFNENVVVAGTSYPKEANFIILLPEKGLTSFSINKRTSFFVASHAGVFRGARFSSPKNACVGG